MLADGFRSQALTLDLDVSADRLVFRYVIDDRPAARLVVVFPYAPPDAPPALDIVVAAAAIYLGSLSLAQTIRIRGSLSPGLIDDLSPIVEMLYDIRRWKDELPLGDRPVIDVGSRSVAAPDHRLLDEHAAATLWSGGKDSTLGLLTLRANGYRTHTVHMRANVGVEDVEHEAVLRLAQHLGEPFDVVTVEHDDFLPFTKAYADAWDAFPLCNRVPFGRDLLLGALGAMHALETGASNISLGHDNECRTAEVIHHGKRVPRNDLESAAGAACFESALRRHLHPALRLLPPVANLSELRILHDMFTHRPELMDEAAFCFWGTRCGRCAKCLRYYLADRLYGPGRLRFAVNPLGVGACPELSDHLDPQSRSTLFQTEVLLMLGRLAQRGDLRPGEDELERFRDERLAQVASSLDVWERELLTDRMDTQVPQGYRPLYSCPLKATRTPGAMTR